jgi:hypothetical protein
MDEMLNECPTAIDFDVYQPRNPKASAYYRCVEDHFEQLETVWLPAPLPARKLTARRVEPTARRGRTLSGPLLLFCGRMCPMSSGAIWPPASRAYASESAAADSTCTAAMPYGWPHNESAGGAHRLNPSSSMISPHRPARMIT